jgi:hypothetical protein
MILQRSVITIVLLILSLAFVYIWLANPQVARQITEVIFRILVGLAQIAWKIVEALFRAIGGIYKNFGVKGLVVVAVVLIAAALFFSIKHDANCGCWPEDGKIYKPGKGCNPINMSDEPPNICGVKARAFSECWIEEGISRCRSDKE